MRARIRSVDLGDGGYTLTLLLPDDARLVGDVNLTVTLLFHALGGLARTLAYYDDYADQPLLSTLLHLERAGGCGAGNRNNNDEHAHQSILLPPNRECREVDFTRQPYWDGHWLRAADEDDVTPSLSPSPSPPTSCAPLACAGSPPSAVLSSPWVYRLRECHMRLYDPPAARKCLHGSWLFSSGDSNFLDTAGNILSRTLGLAVEGVIDMPAALPRGRSFDVRGQSPQAHNDGVGNPGGGLWHDPDGGGGANFSFRISNIWNAAPAESGEPHEQCCHGVAMSSNPVFRGKHEGLIRGAGAIANGPDIVFINSGLHDGMRYSLSPWGLRDFASDVIVLAVPFWRALRSLAATGRWDTADGEKAECQPRMFWRSTVAPAGIARSKRANPQFVEIMNRLVASALQGTGVGGAREEGAGADDDNEGAGGGPRHRSEGCARPHHTATPEWSFLDAFDLTFPFHMDNKWSDGGHYGRHLWKESDHVDRMLIQTLLNGLGC